MIICKHEARYIANRTDTTKKLTDSAYVPKMIRVCGERYSFYLKDHDNPGPDKILIFKGQSMIENLYI